MRPITMFNVTQLITSADQYVGNSAQRAEAGNVFGGVRAGAETSNRLL